VSADFGTEHFKGYFHGHTTGPGYIHVVMRAGDGPFSGEAPLGNFTLGEITELAALAGQAWPSGPGVSVRYVIECQSRTRPDAPWTEVWWVVADETGDAGVSEDYAQLTFEGMTNSMMEWRLVRRTVVSSDEIFSSSPDGGHDD